MGKVLLGFFIIKHDRGQSGQAALQVATMLVYHKQMDKRTTMKSQNRSAALGRPAMKLLGVGGIVCGRPSLALSSALATQTVVRFAWKIPSS